MGSEERFKALFEAAGDAIFLMDGDTFVACNQKTLDIFMCPRERIIGNQPYVLSPAFQPDGQPSKEKARHYIDAALAGELQRFPWRHLRCDGTEFDAEVTLTRVQLEGKYYLQAIVRDKTAEIALQREQERLVAIIEHTPEYIGTTTPDGKVVYLNDAFKRIIPERFREQLGQPGTVPFTAFHPPETGRMLSETAIPYAMKHGMWQGESALLDSRGKPFAVLQTIVAHLDAAGRLEFISTICRDIEAYKAAQQKVETSERRFRGLIENSAEGIMLLTAEGNVAYESVSSSRICGRRPEDRLGTPAGQHIHPDDRAAFDRWFRDVLANPGKPLTVQARNQRADGVWTHLEVTGTNQLENPVIAGIVVNLRDITTEQEAETKQKRILDLLVRAERAAGLGTYEYDVARGGWTSTAQLDEIFGITKDYPHDINGWTAIIHPEEREAMRRYFVDEVLGKRQRFDREYRILRPRDGAVRWVQGYGDLEYDKAGQPVRMIGTIEDVTDTHDFRRDLRAAEERFRIATEQTGQLIYDWDMRANTQVWDGDTERIIGYTLAECRNISNEEWARMIHPDDRAEATRLLDAAIRAGTPYHATYRYRRKDGSYIRMEDTGTFLKDAEGKVYRMIGAMKDVTAQYGAEEVRHRAEERFRLATRQTGQLIYDWNIAESTATWDGAVTELTGFGYDEFRNTTIPEGWAALIHPDDRAAAVDLLQRTRTTGTTYHTEYRFRRKDGSYALMEDTGAFLKDAEGKVYRMIGAMKDVTEARAAAQRIRTAEERFRLAAEQTGQLIYDWNIQENAQTQWEGAILRFTGYTPEEYRAIPNERWYDLIHPDDRADTLKLLEETQKNGSRFTAEYRFRRKDGSYLLVEDTGIFLRNPAGTAVRLIGTLKDVTEVREAAKARERQTAMFREVIDNALDAITIVGPDGNYRYQNRAAWEISGYSPDDPGEVNAFQHIHPEDLERVRTIFTQGLQAGTPLAATFRYRKKDGSWQWLEVAGISLLNNPLVKGAILFSRDITEQRTAQTRVQEARDRLDAIINAIGDPVFVKDTEHRWVLVNDAFCRLVGKSKKELLGKSDYDVFPAPQADAAWAKDAEVLASGAEIATEEVLNDAKGNPQYLFTKKTVYTDPSGVKFIVGIMRDISVLRRARETEARAEELERLNKVMVGRELRMIELKAENERLAQDLEKLRGTGN